MLARIRKAMDEKEEGFTLIELLVVIIIIGILAAIAIPVFLNQRKKGYDSQAKSDVRNAVTIFETYATDYSGAYPSIGTTSAGVDLTTNAVIVGDQLTVGKSTNDLALYGTLSTSATFGASTTNPVYQIAALSQSGKEFCYNSGKASNGVYSVTPASTTVATPGDCV